MDGIDKEGSELLAHVFNRMNIDQKNGLSDDVINRLTTFMINNGYRLCFDGWYLQLKPNPKRLTPNTL